MINVGATASRVTSAQAGFLRGDIARRTIRGMTNRAALLGVAAALTLGACASGPRAHAGIGSRAPLRAPPRGSRAAFAPSRFQAVFATAVEVLRERGLDIASCDAQLGNLVTTPVETDAPCWGTTCLARETTEVKLGYRRARVTLTREVWDPGVRAWRPSEDVSAHEEIVREERDILERMFDAPERAPRPRGPDRDPCDARRCRDAGCVASSAIPGR
jgi:hypothetical protein